MNSDTIYNIAATAMRHCIARYLDLASKSDGFSKVKESDFEDKTSRVILLAGKGANPRTESPHDAFTEWQRRLGVPFDVEAGVSFGVYEDARKRGGDLFVLAETITSNFSEFSANKIAANPQLLPIWQHLGGMFSKAALKKQIGSASDNSISRPAGQRIADLLKERLVPGNVIKGEILKRLESTLEGIVRDLVGRLLLESIIDSSLVRHGVEFQREDEYAAL